MTGILPRIYYAPGITNWLYAQAIRIFDYFQPQRGVRSQPRAKTLDLHDSVKRHLPQSAQRTQSKYFCFFTGS